MAIIKKQLEKIKLFSNFYIEAHPRLSKVLFDYMGIVYVALIIAAILFYFIGFELISVTASMVCYTLYFIVAALGILSLTKGRFKVINIVIFILLPVLYLILVFIYPLLVVPSIFVIIFSLKKRIIALYYAIVSSIVLAGLIFLLPIILIGSIGEITKISEIPSPNGQYVMVEIESDEGALGGSVTVKLDRVIISGILIKHEKILHTYKWSFRPSMKWIDNENVELDGKQYNIFS
ncbi:MAG: hypothetical protein HPY50_17395 [Firmicutes bacterium]|nr:hypothetical protein [Bacillota bacterium]